MVAHPRTVWRRVLSGTGSLAFILALFSGSCPADESKSVLMLLSGDSPVYQKVADNTIKRIEKQCKSLFTTCPKITYRKIDISETGTVLPEKANIVITFGTRAASFVESTATQDHLILAMESR